jgi:hypothetical protein
MNPFRNPWFVGVLAVVAVALVVNQTFHPRWPHFAGGGGPAPAPPAPAADTRHPAPTAPQPAPSAGPQLPAGPGPAMDSMYAESHLPGWINTPKRDPFLQAGKSGATPVQMPRLKLKAIWRQHGVSMVAINQGIYRLGDVVEGCIIININDNEVWLELNGQKKVLGFDTPEPANVSPSK